MPGVESDQVERYLDSFNWWLLVNEPYKDFLTTNPSVFSTFHGLYHDWLYNTKGLYYVDFLTPQDFADNIKQAIIAWWNAEGSSIYGDASASLLQWIRTNGPDAMQFWTATHVLEDQLKADPATSEAMNKVCAGLHQLLNDYRAANQQMVRAAKTQIAFELSTIPWSSLTSGNYMNYDWNDTHFNIIADAIEEYRDAKEAVNE